MAKKSTKKAAKKPAAKKATPKLTASDYVYVDGKKVKKSDVFTA